MLNKILFWIISFLAYFVVIVTSGAFLGTFIAPVVGNFTHPDLGVIDLMERGMSIGARFACVWAGGLALVLCFIQGHNKRSVLSIKKRNNA